MGLSYKLGAALPPWWLRWYRMCLQYRRPKFDPWVRKIPWGREWQPTLVFLPGDSHGQRSLVGYSPWVCKESDTNEQLPQISNTYLLTEWINIIAKINTRWLVTVITWHLYASYARDDSESWSLQSTYTSPSLYTFGIMEDALQHLTHFQNPVTPSLAHYCSNFHIPRQRYQPNLPERCPSVDSAIK